MMRAAPLSGPDQRRAASAVAFRTGRACVLALLVLASIGGRTSDASAQPSVRRPAPPVSPTTPPDSSGEPTAQQPAPRARFDSPLAAALSWLSAADVETRIRGFERLGGIGTAQALEKLEAALEGTDDVQLRLSGMRALAPHARDERASRALVRLMTSSGIALPVNGVDLEGGAVGVGREVALERMLRFGAALALAGSDTPGARRALAKALRGEGLAAEAAAEATVAFPPRELGPLLESRAVPTLGVVETLARLEDQRAFGALRDAVLRGASSVRARAAVALTGSGDLETVELARRWIVRDQPAVLRVAGARILTMTRAPGASDAVARLLEDPATRPEGLALALGGGSPELVPALERGLAEERVDDRVPLWFAAIGRAGGAPAASLLSRELARAAPVRASFAAYALATSPGKPARIALERSLRRAGARRLAARSAVVRTVVLAERPRGLVRILERLLASRVPADRAAGAWGIATLLPDRAPELVTSSDPVIARAAAGAPLRGRAAQAAVDRLLRERDPLTRLALSNVLTSLELVHRIPTAMLLDWLETSPALAPLGAFALATRGDQPGMVSDLMKSGAPLLRSSVALGLGHSARSSATGMLEQMYGFEPDVDVRRAVVIALGRRPDPGRRRTLELAARLDADSDVRAAARAALAGAMLVVADADAGVLWHKLESTDHAAPALTVAGPGRVPVPAVADPDGVVVRLGLRRGMLIEHVWSTGSSQAAVSRPAPGGPRAYSRR